MTMSMWLRRTSEGGAGHCRERLQPERVCRAGSSRAELGEKGGWATSCGAGGTGQTPLLFWLRWAAIVGL